MASSKVIGFVFIGLLFLDLTFAVRSSPKVQSEDSYKGHGGKEGKEDSKPGGGEMPGYEKPDDHDCKGDKKDDCCKDHKDGQKGDGRGGDDEDEGEHDRCKKDENKHDSCKEHKHDCGKGHDKDEIIQSDSSSGNVNGNGDYGNEDDNNNDPQVRN